MALIDPTAVLGPLTGAAGARFDPTKMSWLGTPTTDTPVCVAASTAAVKRRMISSPNNCSWAITVGSTTHSYPTALRGLLGMKFKSIAGFPSSADVLLAVDRGEVEGICESLESLTKMRPDWFSSGKVHVLFQGAVAPNLDLKGVPFILDFAHTEEDKQAISFLYAGQGIGAALRRTAGHDAGYIEDRA